MLEPDGEPFDPLLVPSTRWSSARSGSPAKSPPADTATRTSARAARTDAGDATRRRVATPVCVQGEANGWPARIRRATSRRSCTSSPAGRRRASLRSGGGAAASARPATPRHIGLPRGAPRRRRQRRVVAAIVAGVLPAPTSCGRAMGHLLHQPRRGRGLDLPTRRIDLRGDLTQSSLRPRGGTLEAAWRNGCCRLHRPRSTVAAGAASPRSSAWSARSPARPPRER